MVNANRLEQVLIENMKKGNEKDIIKGLYHEGALYRINAIINVVKYKFLTTKIIERLIELKDDNVVVSGYSVSVFAIAALHFLGYEKYNGGNNIINKLILSKFEFYG